MFVLFLIFCFAEIVLSDEITSSSDAEPVKVDVSAWARVRHDAASRAIRMSSLDKQLEIVDDQVKTVNEQLDKIDENKGAEDEEQISLKSA